MTPDSLQPLNLITVLFFLPLLFPPRNNTYICAAYSTSVRTSVFSTRNRQKIHTQKCVFHKYKLYSSQAIFLSVGFSRSERARKRIYNNEERKKEMGEEEKKSKEAGKPADEEKKELESAKIEEKKSEESKAEQQPPQDIILKVYMHCEGCATKVRRCLKGFEGVEDVKTDYRTSKVVVKGGKADPLKVLERIKKKSRRQVELISPIPKPLEEPKKPQEKEVMVKSDEEKETPDVITVVLGVYMHCEACAHEIKKRIQRMKGVGSAEPDLKRSQVTVKGVFEPETLVEYVHRKTGKHAAIVATEAEKKEEEGKGTGGGEPEKKVEEGEKEAKKPEENKDDNGGREGEPSSKPAAEVDTSELEMKRSESYHHYSAQNHDFNPQKFVPEWAALYEYPPQMFSDENPNACTVM